MTGQINKTVVRCGFYVAVFGLSACMDTIGEVARAPFSALGLGPEASAPATPVNAAAPQPALGDGTGSEIINQLLSRRSVLTPGPYADLAEAVLATNARAAEADLRAARLRAEAKASNWLPTLGPEISLTSLGSVVSSLVVDAVLFDNGGKKAERAYAAADVEVAAVALSQDTNDRVLTALELYLTASAARARSEVNQAALVQMDRYAFIMSERVKGGVSSRVDLNIVEQKRNLMRTQLATDAESATTALAELSAMSARPVDTLSGRSPLNRELVAQPLSLLKAEAEATRSVAEARAARAGLLPSLVASAQTGSAGSGGGLSIGGVGIGLGTGASLKALEEVEAAANARVAQEREDANRQLQALEAELASLRRQDAQSAALARQAAANFEVYAAQQREGTRSVSEVVGLFEAKVRAERAAVDVAHTLARTELKIAALKGVLVNGEDV